MIGDRIDNDIVPAKALGMKTIWIRQGFDGLYEGGRNDAFVWVEIICLKKEVDALCHLLLLGDAIIISTELVPW